MLHGALAPHSHKTAPGTPVDPIHSTGRAEDVGTSRRRWFGGFDAKTTRITSQRVLLV